MCMLNIYNQKNNNKDDLVPQKKTSESAKVGDVNKYEDPTGEFTSKEFNRSVWFVTHKILLYKAAIAALIVMSVFFWGFSVWRWGDYIINGISSDISLYQNLSQFSDYTTQHPRFAPANLNIAGTSAFSSNSKAYDLVAQVSNPNNNFVVNFDYYFTVNGESTSAKKSFLLAGESKPLVYFGYENGYPSDVSIVIENIVWNRISTHEIQNVLSWQNERLSFSTRDFSFTPPETDGIQANVIKFNIQNDSSFGYRDGKFVVALLQNDSLVGVMHLSLSDFRSLETRAVDLRNYASNLTVTDIQIYPEIDIYNKGVYLAPQR